MMEGCRQCAWTVYDTLVPGKFYRILQLPRYKRLRVQNRFPDLFWLEKIVIVLDYLQLYGLLWNVANPWPWPYLWLHFTRNMCGANLDLFSLSTNGAIMGQTGVLTTSEWGRMHGYLTYALYFAIGNAIICVALMLSMRLIQGEKGHALLKHVPSMLLMLCYAFYMPVGLTTSRLYYCEDGVLAVDPDITCLGSSHLMYLIICSVLVVPSFIALPIYFYRRANFNLVYRYEAVDHEKDMQLKELSCLLGLNTMYIDKLYWISAPFRLSAIYYYAHMLVLKALLLIIFIVLRKYLVIQSMLYLSITAVFVIRSVIFSLPYRAITTNGIYLSAAFLLLFNTTFASLNTFGMHNSVTVASTQTYILIAVNLIILCFILITTGYCITNSFELYPPLRALLFVISDPNLSHYVQHWIDTLRDADIIRKDFLIAPVTVADLDSLEDSIRSLHRCYMEARSLGSLFQHLLGEQVAVFHGLHAMTRHATLRRTLHFLPTIEASSSWRDHFYQAMKAETYAGFNERYRLNAPLKRKILLKLLAVRAFQAAGAQRRRERSYSKKKSMIMSMTSPIGSPAVRCSTRQSKGSHVSFSGDFEEKMVDKIPRDLDYSELLTSPAAYLGSINEDNNQLLLLQNEDGSVGEDWDAAATDEDDDVDSMGFDVNDESSVVVHTGIEREDSQYNQTGDSGNPSTEKRLAWTTLPILEAGQRLEEMTVNAIHDNDPKTMFNGHGSKDDDEIIDKILIQLDLFEELYSQWDEIIAVYEKAPGYIGSVLDQWRICRKMVTSRIQVLSMLEIDESPEDEIEVISPLQSLKHRQH